MIAERRGEVVGCLHVLATTDFFGLRHAHVSVLATTAAAEGTGVARALMAHAEAWTAKRGLPLLTLNVFDRNARARRFYEQSGFEVEMVKYREENGLEIKSQDPTPKLQPRPTSKSQGRPGATSESQAEALGIGTWEWLGFGAWSLGFKEVPASSAPRAGSRSTPARRRCPCTQVLDAHPAGPEPAGGQVAEAVEEGDAVRELRRGLAAARRSRRAPASARRACRSGTSCRTG